MELDKFKTEYETLAKRFSLPKFMDLNLDFEIDKFDGETDFLLRAIRKLMMEKIVNSISFLEMLINPINAPRMYINYVSSMSSEDRKVIEDIYSVLTELSISSLSLEIDYSEKNEAALIKETHQKWSSLKPNFKNIVSNIKKPNNIKSVRKERSYFG